MATRLELLVLKGQLLLQEEVLSLEQALGKLSALVPQSVRLAYLAAKLGSCVAASVVFPYSVQPQRVVRL